MHIILHFCRENKWHRCWWHWNIFELVDGNRWDKIKNEFPALNLVIMKTEYDSSSEFQLPLALVLDQFLLWINNNEIFIPSFEWNMGWTTGLINACILNTTCALRISLAIWNFYKGKFDTSWNSKSRSHFWKLHRTHTSHFTMMKVNETRFGKPFKDLKMSSNIIIPITFNWIFICIHWKNSMPACPIRSIIVIVIVDGGWHLIIQIIMTWSRHGTLKMD